MKKRLSLLMAALMIITMLPMSSFAAASAVYTTLDIPASTSETDTKLVSVTFKLPNGQAVTAGKLRMEIDNGAEFKPAAATLSAAELDVHNVPGTLVSSRTAPVSNIIFFELSGGGTVNTDTASITLNVPVYFPNEGDVQLRLIDESNTGVGTLAPIKVAVVRASSTSLSVVAKDAEKAVSFDGGELSQFEIKNFSAVNAATRTLEITLDDSSISFDPAKTKVFVDGVEVPGAAAASKITLTNTQLANGTAKNVLVLPVVSAMGRKASEGPVKVNVAVVNTAAPATTGAAAVITNVATANAVIGKVVDYVVTMTIVEKGKKEIPSVWGGEKVTVTVTLKGPKGSISDRTIDFTMEGSDVTYTTASVTTKPSGSSALKGTDDGGVFKDGEFEVTAPPRDVTEVKFDIELQTSHSKDGVAVLTAAQRGWEVKADAAKITPKLSVKAEEMPVKKGEARATADIVITEAKAGLLTKSDKLQVRFDTRRDYTQFSTKAVKIEATNGMKFGEPVYGGGGKDYTVLEFPITKGSSGEPAVITISGVKVLVDGSATDDVVKVFAQLNGKKVANTDYIKVVKEYALESILTVFTVGQTEYTVNGVAKSAASAPYIKNGRTMLPIRALAESLGLTVQWNSATKTATFADDTKVAGVVIGSDTMYVNGVPVKLAAKAELVNGTTFVELRSLATAFSVQIDWDAAAKTATVSK